MKRETMTNPTLTTAPRPSGRYHCYDLFYFGSCDSLTCPKKHTPFENEAEIQDFVSVYSAIVIRDLDKPKNPNPQLAAYIVSHYVEILEKSKNLKRVKSSRGNFIRSRGGVFGEGQGAWRTETSLCAKILQAFGPSS